MLPLLALLSCAHHYNPLATPVALPLQAPTSLTLTADLGATGTAHVVIRNTGTSALRLNELVLVQLGHFRLDAGALPKRLRPEEELAFDVSYTPVDMTNRSAAVVLRTHAGVHTIGLSGRAPEDKTARSNPVGVLGALRDGADIGGLFAAKPPATPPSELSGLGTAPTVPRAADPVILGAMDKGQIDAEIKRNTGGIRHCYQRVLTAHPTLSGRVTIKFVVAKDGSVSTASVKQTTFPVGGVEQCMIETFIDYEFPEPKGGGIVIVSYPFIFSPG